MATSMRTLAARRDLADMPFEEVWLGQGRKLSHGGGEGMRSHDSVTHTLLPDFAGGSSSSAALGSFRAPTRQAGAMHPPSQPYSQHGAWTALLSRLVRSKHPTLSSATQAVQDAFRAARRRAQQALRRRPYRKHTDEAQEEGSEQGEEEEGGVVITTAAYDAAAALAQEEAAAHEWAPAVQAPGGGACWVAGLDASQLSSAAAAASGSFSGPGSSLGGGSSAEGDSLSCHSAPPSAPTSRASSCRSSCAFASLMSTPSRASPASSRTSLAAAAPGTALAPAASPCCASSPAKPSAGNSPAPAIAPASGGASAPASGLGPAPAFPESLTVETLLLIGGGRHNIPRFLEWKAEMELRSQGQRQAAQQQAGEEDAREEQVQEGEAAVAEEKAGSERGRVSKRWWSGRKGGLEAQ